jgi:flagellar biosynthesis/type III secretory pathway protein FliH
MTKILKRGGDATVAVPQAPRPAGVLPRAVYDAERDAAAVRAEAERLAAETVGRAEREAEAIRADARARGREEGLAEVTETVARAAAERARLERELERDLCALALSVAEKVLHRALALDPSLVTSVCAAALAESRAATGIVLEVHPDDVARVEEARSALEGALGRRDAFVVRAVETVGRGGCVVVSSLGRVDARLETQLAAIRAALGVG